MLDHTAGLKVAATSLVQSMDSGGCLLPEMDSGTFELTWYLLVDVLHHKPSVKTEKMTRMILLVLKEKNPNYSF